MALIITFKENFGQHSGDSSTSTGDYPKINNNKCYFIKNGKWTVIDDEINNFVKNYIESLNEILIDSGTISL